MSYQVLARKYRPQTFAEVVGQEHVVRTLSNAIATGRIAHAFLFVGPRGIGKTSTARILAKALNCTNGPKAEFDPNDEVCREIAEGRSMDVLEIDGASNNSVEQIRELRDNVQYAPSKGNFKIYIIDEVHMLTPAAFNALLKTLEEPPAHVKFIFATTEPHKVLPTILSRCQRFDLKRISDLDIAKQLGFIASHEGIEVSEQALRILARNAEGGMRDAESAFDQLISFCGNKIEEKDVLEIFGLTGPREIWDLAEAIQAGSSEEALHQVRNLVARGKDLTRLTQELLRYFRNLLVFSVSPEISKQELDETELRHFEAIEPLPSKELILAFIDELVRLEERIRYALVKEVLFEVTMLRMAQQKQRVSLEELLKHLTSGTPVPAIPVVTTPAPTPIPKAAAPAPALKPTTAPEVPIPAPKPAAIVLSTPPASSGASLPPEQLWSRLLEPLKKTEIVLRRALDCCIFEGQQGSSLNVRMVSSRAIYDNLIKSPGYSTLENAVRKTFGPEARLQIRFEERADEPVPTPAASPSAASSPTPIPEAPRKKDAAPAAVPGKPLDKADFENDPLIKAALEAFDARIVHLRD